MISVATCIPIALASVNAVDLRDGSLERALALVCLACGIEALYRSGLRPIAWAIAFPMAFWTLWGVSMQLYYDVYNRKTPHARRWTS